MFPSIAAALLLTSLASVVPAQVPGKGHQEAILTVAKAGMFHIETTGTPGTRCELVDHLRGPFATAGEIGHVPCSENLLLDEGVYKVRLDSRKKGKGTVSLKVAPFTELNTETPALTPGAVVDLKLRPGQQASYWVRLDTRQALTLWATGRTAGRIELWRDGRWREEVAEPETSFEPVPGHRIHEQWINKVLEAGTYLVTVYGVDPEKWTTGPDSDDVRIGRGFPAGSPGGSEAVVLPSNGTIGFAVPEGPVTASMFTPKALTTAASLEIHPFQSDNLFSSSAAATCVVLPLAQIPGCRISAGAPKERHVVIVKGPPGAAVQLQWVVGRTLEYEAGPQGADEDMIFHVQDADRYLVATADLPPDIDALPLSCVLTERHPGKGPDDELASDMLEISPSKPFQRPFNYDRSRPILWFHVTEGGTFHLTTTGDRVNSCTLWRKSNTSDDQLQQSLKDAKHCDLDATLAPGEYRLDLFGDKSGVEKLRIASGNKEIADTPPKAGCTIPQVVLAPGPMYRLRLSRGGESRQLSVRRGRDSLATPLPLTLDQGRFVKVMQGGGDPIVVYGPAGAFTCGMGRAEATEAPGGACHPKDDNPSDQLIVWPKGTDPVSITIVRARPEAKPAGLSAYHPELLTPPELPVDKPMFFNFEREESHSLLFDVKEAGLYDVTTEGLLATTCTLRTAVVPSLGSNANGGRGLNCLLEQYLRPGHYLLTAQTTGLSRGRAALVLHQRKPRLVESVTNGGDAFFRSEAGELIQQRLDVPKPASYDLATTALGIPLQCRLEDADGWPLVAAPTQCSQRINLDKGSYIWMQLPLTVESMRLTHLAQVLPPVVFEGKKVHALVLNEWADAILRKSGKDEFFINVLAETDLSITLTSSMQGQLYRINPDKSLTAVDFIPSPDALGGSAAPAPEESSPNGDEGNDNGDAPNPPDGSDDSGNTNEEGGDEGSDQAMGDDNGQSEPVGEGSDGESANNESAQERKRHKRGNDTPPVPTAAPAVSGDHVVHLTAGPYKLITEHIRKDAHVRYRIFVGSDTLVPGSARTLTAPTFLTLRVPEDGVLRLKTTGETDVGCRIFDGKGTLVAENDHNGDDWNCSFAEPFTHGDYRLVIESETLNQGETRVSVSMATVQDTGVLTSGARLQVKDSVLVAEVPPAAAGGIQELSFRASEPFSCALEQASGWVLERRLNVTDCGFLLHTNDKAYRVRLWTLDRPVEVTTSIAQRAIVANDSGHASPNEVARASIRNAGLYATADDALCLPAGEGGPLHACGGSVSLETGDWLFAGPPGKRLEADLRELTMSDDEASIVPVSLTRAFAIQRSHASSRNLHLLRITVGPGERNIPACGIADGARSLLPNGCVAASRASDAAVLQWWGSTDVPVEASVFRASAPYPSRSPPLGPGHTSLSWTGASARYTLPASSHRLDLILPPDGWAVRMESNGAIGDLCAATAKLSRCILSGAGGELVVYAPSGPHADATLLLTAAPTASTTVTTVVEELLAEPGTRTYTIPPANVARTVRIEGAAHALTTLVDGTRSSGNEAPLPAGQSAEVSVDADVGALRVSVGSPEQPELARFGASVPGNSAPGLHEAPAEANRSIPWSEAIALSGGIVHRTFTTDHEAVAHLRADSGVCAIADSKGYLGVSGFGGSCSIDRLLPAGSYRILVRQFGAVPMTGTVSWTTDPVESLSDGVGPEAWLAAGQEKLYRFQTASPGHIGVGLQVPADTIDCTVLDAAQHVLGTGCQQFPQLDAGTYLLAIRAPAGVAPISYRPVLVGLAGASRGVPEDFLRDFFNRIGEAP